MTEPGSTVPPAEATFESLEAELKQVTGQLESPAVPLEKRLQLHARAASMHRRLEAIVEAARKATSDAGPEDPRTGEGAAQPYEAVRDRLAEVVNALEADDLPLARVIDLHREAQRLASRCEAILDAAQEQISGAAAGPAPAAPDNQPSAREEAPDSDAPF